jgi:hypothetical protein
MCSFDTYYLVKLAGVHWDGGPFVWVTLHPEFMHVERIASPGPNQGQPGYCLQRAAKGLHSNYEIVAPLKTEVGAHHQHNADRHVTYLWPGMTASGSSGLFAVKVALDDGHDRVVLAGVPMTVEDKHFLRGQPWIARDSFTQAWPIAMPHIHGKVKSLSGGFTEELLGAPTPEWLGVIPRNLKTARG